MNCAIKIGDKYFKKFISESRGRVGGTHSIAYDSKVEIKKAVLVDGKIEWSTASTKNIIRELIDLMRYDEMETSNITIEMDRVEDLFDIDELHNVRDIDVLPIFKRNEEVDYMIWNYVKKTYEPASEWLKRAKDIKEKWNLTVDGTLEIIGRNLHFKINGNKEKILEIFRKELEI